GSASTRRSCCLAKGEQQGKGRRRGAPPERARRESRQRTDSPKPSSAWRACQGFGAAGATAAPPDQGSMISPEERAPEGFRKATSAGGGGGSCGPLRDLSNDSSDAERRVFGDAWACSGRAEV